MSERPEASHHFTPADDDEAGVTDAVTPVPGADQPDADPSTPEVTDDSINSDDINTEAVNDPAEPDAPTGPAAATDAAPPGHPDTRLAAERLEDLQRLQAEYVNYKRRVDRDRALVQERAIADVLDSMLPVLDDIHAARGHGDLTEGPFAAIAEKLEGSLGKFGLERFGAVGDAFDPTVHEALLHQSWDPAITPADPEATTIVLVLQPGYRTGDHIIRPARVAVADPS